MNGKLSFRSVVECELCSEKFTEASGKHSPRILVCCGNSYCSCCVENLLHWSHSCPVCRSEDIKSKGLSDLPLNRAILTLLELLCEVCGEEKGVLTCPGCCSSLCQDCFLLHCSSEIEVTESRLKQIRQQQGKVVQRVCSWLLTFLNQKEDRGGGGGGRRAGAGAGALDAESAALTVKLSRLHDAVCINSAEKLHKNSASAYSL